MTNYEWKTLIAKEFNVSKSTANEMLHAMYYAKRLKDVRSGNSITEATRKNECDIMSEIEDFLQNTKIPFN